MSLLHRFLATGAPAPQTYVDDVFSAYTYTGNSSTQTITNGIDLAGRGGLVWQKHRTGAAPQSNWLVDTTRGAGQAIRTDTTSASTDVQSTFNQAFLSNGFSFNSSNAGINDASYTYASWTFRKAPKFFDVVTYTGNGVVGRQIAHSLGIPPGMIVVKRTDTTSDWTVFHIGTGPAGNGNLLLLNTTAAQYVGNEFQYTTPSSTAFTISQGASMNASGGTYVAYLFAHDTSATGLIQCGSFIGTSIAGVNVTLNFEPQFVMVKRATGGTGSWYMMDSMRGMSVTDDSYLAAESSAAESTFGGAALSPTATGFRIDSTGTGLNASGSTYIYLAIRRPNKPPILGTQVYNAIARTGTGAAATVTGVGFAPDLALSVVRTASYGNVTVDRLRGASQWVSTRSTDAEASDSNIVSSMNMDGVSFGSSLFVNSNTLPYIHHFFKRAPGTMDEICFTGTGSNTTQAHNLAAAPELWLVKSRSGATQWVWGSSLLAATEKIVMPSVNGRVTDATVWNSTYPTSTVLSLGTSTDVNNSGATYVGYLWATKAGVSKVGTYTGNGSSQTVNCGFTTGARFVMIIRATASTSQDIYIWDSTRGIVAASDPRLSLNTTAAEVTTLDTVDADTSGFIVNTDASNVNVNGAVYLYLSYA